MSLIDEALKKARLESARKEADRRGFPSPAATAGLPGRPVARRWRRPLVAGLAIGGGVAALATGLGLYLARESARPTAGTSAPPATATEAETRPGPADQAPAVAEEAPPPPAPTTAAAAEPAPEPPPSPTDSAAGPTAPEAEVVDAPPPEVPIPLGALATASAPAELAAAGASSPPDASGGTGAAGPAGRRRAVGAVKRGADDEGAIYRREAPIAGGGKLVLSGIAWRETDPVAVLNGQVLGAGEGVEGYVIVAIERDRVHLRGPDGDVTLLLR